MSVSRQHVDVDPVEQASLRTPGIREITTRLAVKLADTPDIEFPAQFAENLAQELNIDFVLISRINKFANMARTICFLEHGIQGQNLSYTLHGTPCERIVETGDCLVENNVCNAFPQSPFLKKLGIEGLAGMRLDDVDGEPIGVFLTLSTTSLSNTTRLVDVAKFFHKRLARGLSLSETFERQAEMIEVIGGGSWDWDILTGGTTMTKNLQHCFGFQNGKGPYDINDIENLMHDDDRAAHADALKNHLDDDAPYRLRVRIKMMDNTYRPFLARGKVVRNAAGKPVRMLGIFTDITLGDSDIIPCH